VKDSSDNGVSLDVHEPVPKGEALVLVEVEAVELESQLSRPLALVRIRLPD